MKIGFKLWHPLLLAGLCLLAYGNSLNGKFVFDDVEIVFQPEVINANSLGAAFSLTTGWRQLLYSTYALNYYLGGLAPFGYHVLNLLLHVLNVLLVYGIILVLLRRQRAPSHEAALAGAAIFAVHTFLSSAVSYIAGRSSVLCATFYFAAILLFLYGLESVRRQTRIFYFLLTALAGFLAWQTKQEAITLPLLMASFLFLEAEKKDWRWIGLLAGLPLVVAFLIRDQLAILYGVVAENRELVSAGFGEVLALPVYFQTYVTAVAGYYLPRFAFPAGLSADPHIVPVEHWYRLEFILSLLMLVGLAWLAVHFRRREPLFSIGLTALLISPLAAYAVIPLPDVVLEHRAYVPGLGVALLAAWIFQWLARNHTKLRWAVAAALIAVLTSMTAKRNTVWANNVVLWEDAVAKAPAKPRPHFNLGQAYQEAGRTQDALREYQRTLELKPDFYAAYSNISAILLNQGQFDRARDVLLKLTAQSPDFTEGFINLGVLYIRQRQPDMALEALNRAIEISPDNFAAQFNRAEAFTQKGDFTNAIDGYRKAVQIRPDLFNFRLALGTAYWRSGDRAAAVQEFSGMLNGPFAAEAYRNL